MNQERIPFNKPCFIGNELNYISKAIEENHISGDGLFSQNCSTLLERKYKYPKVMLTTSCTHAMEMAAILLNIKEGDEVIIPSYTFPSVANAFVLRGATPVFTDIRMDTLNINEKLIEEKITPRTRAIVIVHYAGVGCEMDKISDIANKHNLYLMEDNAHGLSGKYKNKFLGKFGCLSTNSFHETKNFTCGEGGALIINDENLVNRAEMIREKGTNRKQFFRGEVDKYTWVDIGSSYLPSDLLSAYLLAQLESIELIQNRRKQIWNYYQVNLNDWAMRNGVGLPQVPTYCEQTYHLYYLIFPSLKKRRKVIDYLQEKEIMAVTHYQPLHLSKMGKKFNGENSDCPISEEISETVLRLPIYYNLLDHEMERVVAALTQIDIS